MHKMTPLREDQLNCSDSAKNIHYTLHSIYFTLVAIKLTIKLKIRI